MILLHVARFCMKRNQPRRFDKTSIRDRPVDTRPKVAKSHFYENAAFGVVSHSIEPPKPKFEQNYGSYKNAEIFRPDAKQKNHFSKNAFRLDEKLKLGRGPL